MGSLEEDELGFFVDWPDYCPHCGEADYSYKDWSYPPEDFHSDG
jgi:hypothetical protein